MSGWPLPGADAVFPKERAERAISLGVARKYAALLNHGKRSPLSPRAARDPRFHRRARAWRADPGKARFRRAV